ncbi:MAG: hypothetical protein WBL88_07530 [Nitrososphaeraceae archaeon]
MQKRIPKDIRRYVDDNISHPVGIIGCRSTISEISLDCCEYGLAIFNSEQTNGSNRILNIGNYNVELITLPTLPKQLTDILVLKDMILLHDDNKFMLSSIIEGNSNSNTYRKMLMAFGKKTIIRSLFRYEKINRAIQTQPILAAMWMKISAYDFLEGILSLGVSKPMPLHELYQIRHLTIGRQDIGDAIIAALEYIGVERATRSNISRSFQGVYGLNSTQYDRVNFYKNEASTSDWHVAGLLLLPRQDWRKKLAGKK